MATRAAAGTGNWTTAGSWGLCDSTSENDSVAVSTNVTTSNLDSSTFTPGAITVDAVMLRLAGRAVSPTGTFTVTLRNSTDAVDVTSVTINVSDLPAIGFSAIEGAWVTFKFGSSQVLLAGKAYLIRVVSSSSSQVILWAASGTNWSRQLRTTTTGAPAANDKLLIQGELTGAGTSNSLTITYDNTASTTWGPAAANDAIVVGWKGTLQQQATASTAYLLNFLGRFLVAGNGTWNMAAAMPSSSSLKATAQNVANVDCGFEWRSGGTVTLTGNTLSFVKTKLAADAAAAATSLTTVDSTGWSNGDVLAYATTTRTMADCESKALTANASGTTLTTTALTNAHSGTNNSNGDIRGTIVNLTRNVVLQGNSATLGAYVLVDATAVVTLRYVEFTKLGSATANKRGFDIATTTGTFDMQYCSVHDCTVASSRAWNISSASGSNITISNNVTYNVANQHLGTVASSGVQTYDNNVIMRNTDAGVSLVVLGDIGCTFTNNEVVGGQNHGIELNETAVFMGTFSGNVGHGNSLTGINTSLVNNGGTYQSCVGWRNGSSGINIRGNGAIVDSCVCFGNAAQNLDIASSGNFLLTNNTLHAGTTLTCPIGIRFSSADGQYIGRMETNTIGSPNTHATGDMQCSSVTLPQVVMHNNLLASTTEFSNLANLQAGSWVSSSKHDQTAGNHKTWMAEGIITIDTTSGMYDVTPSLRMSPNINTNSASKMASASLGKGFRLPVANGGTLTVSVKVRNSVSGDGTAYGGTAPRLMVRKNVACGISADTVLATSTSAANGAFETISGTTAAVTDDGCLEFYVDCDGTTGWVNVDSWNVTAFGPSSFGTQRYWSDGQPIVGLLSPRVQGILQANTWFPIG